MLDANDLAIIHRYLDASGRFTSWPKKHRRREAALKYLASKFEYGDYDESDVNNLLRRWHTFNDPCLLRRSLYVARMLHRTPDGRRYWIEPPDVNATLTALRALLPDVNATLNAARQLRDPVAEVVADYLTAHLGPWRAPSEDHPPRLTDLTASLNDPAIDAFLTAVDRVMNSNTLLLKARVQPLWGSFTLSRDLEAVLRTIDFAELFQAAARLRDWCSYPWHESPREMWPSLLIRDATPRLVPLTPDKAVQRLMWTLTKARTYYRKHHLDPDHAATLVHGHLAALIGAPAHLSAEAIAGHWRWVQVDSSILYPGRGSYLAPYPDSRYSAVGYFDMTASDGALLGYSHDTFALLLHNGSS
ncbi:MAG: hypothetical protein CMH57_01125 [Myxococcales bacterium]|nr:hypothetical protein [Myxococcales bacterium]